MLYAISYYKALCRNLAAKYIATVFTAHPYWHTPMIHHMVALAFKNILMVTYVTFNNKRNSHNFVSRINNQF